MSHATCTSASAQILQRVVSPAIRTGSSYDPYAQTHEEETEGLLTHYAATCRVFEWLSGSHILLYIYIFH
jgi:hypothetical protein